MIDITLYRQRIGCYNHCPKGKKVTKRNNLITSLYPFIKQYNYNITFFILYYIYILYFILYGLGICVALPDFAHTTLLTYLPNLEALSSTPLSSSDILSTTVRLYFASITCFLCRRLKIYSQIQTKLKCLETLCCDLTIFSQIFKSVVLSFLLIPTMFFKRYQSKPILESNKFYAAIKENMCLLLHNLGNIIRSIFLKSLVWLAAMNLVLIVLANPSITNPGPPKIPTINNLNVAYQNVQGLIPFGALNDPNPALNMTKILELQSYTYSHKPDLLILNETWLKPSILDDEILASESYNIFRLDRNIKTHPTDPKFPHRYRKNGGGVLIATRADLDITVKPIKIKCHAEILGIQLKFPNGQKIVVCTLYRVGTLGTENFTKVEAYLQNICKRRGISNFVLLGDLNLSSIKWSTLECECEIEKSFLSLFDNLGLTQLVKEPTHNKGNILDLVLATQPYSLSNLTVLDNTLCKSDHRAIKFELKVKTNRIKAPKRQIYNFKKANWVGLNEDLSKVNWHTLINSNDDIELSWQKFKSTLLVNVDKNIPKIKIKSEFQPPWFDSETYELCRKKDRLRAAYKKSKSDETYMKFSDCRRELKHLVKKKMKDNFTSESEPDAITKKFWSYVKSANKSHRLPNSVSYNGCHRTKSSDQAELFNNFFYDQFSEESLYDIHIDNSALTNELFDIKFDHSEICNLLRQINPNKAQGPDGINGRI